MTSLVLLDQRHQRIKTLVKVLKVGGQMGIEFAWFDERARAREPLQLHERESKELLPRQFR